MSDPDRLRAALTAIDEANADDPNRIEVRGELRPKELAHAELASEWVRALAPQASDELLLAARGHHVRRWEIPRSDFAEGRAGYHRWRKALQAHHAERVGQILTAHGYGDESIARVQAIVRKQDLGRDADVQVFEDALCLVFLETQLAPLRARLGDDEKLTEVIRKTAAKMSGEALARVSELPLPEEDVALVTRALD
jgi:hypothetical protein